MLELRFKIEIEMRLGHLVIGYWSLVIGHFALGIGNWTLAMVMFWNVLECSRMFWNVLE